MVIKTVIKNLTIGDHEPVRVMAAINLSQESFYKGSVVDYTKLN